MRHSIAKHTAGLIGSVADNTRRAERRLMHDGSSAVGSRRHERSTSTRTTPCAVQERRDFKLTRGMHTSHTQIYSPLMCNMKEKKAIKFFSSTPPTRTHQTKRHLDDLLSFQLDRPGDFAEHARSRVLVASYTSNACQPIMTRRGHLLC